MNYYDIQILIEHKEIKYFLYLAEKLKFYIEKDTKKTQNQINLYNILIKAIANRKIRLKELDKEIEKKELLTNLTIDDIIEIDNYRK